MYPTLVKGYSEMFLILLVCSEISSLMLEADTCPEFGYDYLNDTSCQHESEALSSEVCGFQQNFSREKPKNSMTLTTNYKAAQIGEKVSGMSAMKNSKRILPGSNTRNSILENLRIFRGRNLNNRISKPNLTKISFIKPETTSERKIIQYGIQTRNSKRSNRNHNSPLHTGALEHQGLRRTKSDKYSRYMSTRLEISSHEFQNERSRDHERRITRFGNDQRQRQNIERLNNRIDQSKFRSNTIDSVRFYRDLQRNNRIVRNRSMGKREIHRANFERFSRRSYDKRSQPTRIQLINGHHIKKNVEPSRITRSQLEYITERNPGTHHNVPLGESVRSRQINDYERRSIRIDYARDNSERHSRVLSPHREQQRLRTYGKSSIETRLNKYALNNIDASNRIYSNYILKYQINSKNRQRNSHNRQNLHRENMNLVNDRNNNDRRSTSFRIYRSSGERISLNTQILSRKLREREISKEDRTSSSRNSRTNNRNTRLADLESRIYKRNINDFKNGREIRRTIYINRNGVDSIHDTNRKIQRSVETVRRKSFKENIVTIGRKNGNLRVKENQWGDVYKNTENSRNHYYSSKLFGDDDQIRQLAPIILWQKTANEQQETLEAEIGGDRSAVSSWLRSIQVTLATIILGQLILSGGNNGKNRIFDWRSVRALRSF